MSSPIGRVPRSPDAATASRWATTSLLVGCALFASCGGGTPPTGVLLISIDSLRADHVSSYGYSSETNPSEKTTPYLDRLMAEGGARFTKAYSTTSWTLPSHMALLSGQPNELHGVRDAPWQLHEEQPYLATAFKKSGWSTFGIWSGPNLDPYFGFERDFDIYADCSRLSIDESAFATADTQGLNSVHDASHKSVTGPRIVDTFTEWYDGLAKDEKFFAFVHMWDPHYDYHAPAEYDIFDPDYKGWITGEGFKDFNTIYSEASPIPRREVQHLKALYDAEIRFTDANIQKMVTRLEEGGRLDSTLIVVVADHGEEFGEHGLYGHKLNLYEETVRVPIMMRLPGTIPAGYAVNGTTSLVDVAPTILDIAKVPGRETMWGRSTLSVFLDNEELKDRLAPMELTVRNEELYRGARGSDFKVIRVTNAMSDKVRGYGRGDPRKFKNVEQFVDRYRPYINTALYTFQKDSKSESHKFNIVVPDLPQPVRELEQLRAISVEPSNQKVRQARDLWDELDTLERPWSTRRRSGELSADLKAQLKAAGYIVDDDAQPADASGTTESGAASSEGSSSSTDTSGSGAEQSAGSGR